jgi:predicted RNA-binding Zn ribbon-like protein
MDAPAFILLGDAVWLDFVNSALGRTPNPPDLLPDAAAFARWAVAQRLLQRNGGPPYDAVHRLRGHLTTLAAALSAGLQPPTGPVVAINELLSSCAGSQRLVRVSGEWRLQFVSARALSPLEAIARSAAATLADRSVSVRRCAGETCTLFLIDATPTRSRRWCSAGVCGANLRVERRRSLRR